MSALAYRIRLLPRGAENAHDLPGTWRGLEMARAAARECLRRAPRFDLAVLTQHGEAVENVWPEQQGE